MSDCKCSMSVRINGDGCRHCQPQEYIDRVEASLQDARDELSYVCKQLDEARGLLIGIERGCLLSDDDAKIDAWLEANK